ncbi:MAG: ATP-binding cassette domain-containing protein [Deltaproteobacteria bacterium]|nr:ATP-binding cassette domain-containing protein [Deltaproteobacteria bacterium]
MGTLVDIKSVSCYTEAGRPLFEDASLSFSDGERVLIIAPLASGKSVLIRMLAGLSTPDKGTVTVLGEDIAALAKEDLNRLRQRIGFVFHDSVLISNLKVIENVALPLIYHRSSLSYEEAMQGAASLIAETGFRGDLWGLPGMLPLYAKKEIALARALILKPEIVICENLWDGLTDTEKRGLSLLLLKYQESNPGSLLIFTALSDADAPLVRPGRVLRIDGSRIIEESRA